MRASHIIAALSLLLGGAQSAFALPQAPHDEANGVTCESCHVNLNNVVDPNLRIAGTLSGATLTSLTDSTKAWAPGAWVGGVVTIDGTGEFRTITASTADTVSWQAPLAAAPTGAYWMHKATYANLDAMACNVCHDPSGPAVGYTAGGVHFVGSLTVGCGDCHDPHNLKDAAGNPTTTGFHGDASGASLLRLNVRNPKGGTPPALTYSAGSYYTADGKGICQVCHTNPGFGFAANQAPPDPADHYDYTTAPQNCMSGGCHSHEDTFATGTGFTTTVGSGHFDATKEAWGDHGPGGWSGSCLRCHTQGGFRDYVGGDGSPDYLGTTFSSTVATTNGYAYGPMTCYTCHNPASNPLETGITSVNFPSLASATGLDKGTAICAQCHQGRESTASINKSVTGGVALAERGLDALTATGGTTGTTTTIADTDVAVAWTVDQWVGFYAFLQTGASAGLYRKITANTVDTLTLQGALPVAVAAGDRYQILPKEDTTVLDAQLTANNSFRNPHYLGAAAMLFGADAYMAYQYPRTATQTDTARVAVYTRRNVHGGQDGCTSCHDAHALGVVVTESTCGRCHFNEAGAPVASLFELEEARQYGFEGDIDGDGHEGALKTEIDNLAAMLFNALRSYATYVAGTPVCYTSAYSYFKIDADGNGVCDVTDTVNYNKFTPRSLRAAFLYKWYKAEPGAWAHNPRYIIEVLYDGIADLNAGLVAKGYAAMPNGFRTFRGHFGAATLDAPMGGEQFRDWDNGTVRNSCSQCHAGQQGFENYLANPATALTNRPVTGMECGTCHTITAGATSMLAMRDLSGYAAVGGGVRFPPASSSVPSPTIKVAADFRDGKDMLCATCHSGRESKASIDAKIGSKIDSDWTITSFTNPHYFGAAAIMFGSETQMGYEFATKTYAGKKLHGGGTASCLQCHDPRATKHSFEITTTTAVAMCATGCHADGNFGAYRGAARAGVDYDGDGTVETLKLELDGLGAALLARISAYSQAGGLPTCYNPASHPYWYKDTNANGVCDAGESTTYNTFNPTLLKAAFNYKWYAAESGAWAHNFDYMAQLLMDSIEALGGPVNPARP